MQVIYVAHRMIIGVSPLLDKQTLLTLVSVRSGLFQLGWHGLLAVGLLSISLLLAPDAQAAADKSQPTWLLQPMSLEDARHLAGRTGFGATPAELARLTPMTRSEAVRYIAESVASNPHIPMPVWVNAAAPHFWKNRTMLPQQRQAFNRDRDAEIVELRRWWVNNMLQTPSPQTERLVLFWHDHFATSYDGVNRRSVAIGRQNQLFRELGMGPYRDLLKAIIRDPALLSYLNNQSNRKGHPNENLARELLELFTLGEGNYDEATVKEAARALTGYGYSDTRNNLFQLHGYKRDLESKTLFGVVGNHDGDALVDLILDQPAAAEYLVKKFWHAFVSDNEPSASFVASQSIAFRTSDYDLSQLYLSVLNSAEFWSNENRLSLIKSPATLLIGTARSLDYPKQAWTQLPALHALLGMDLFSPPNVAGWSEGVAYVAPGKLLNRQLAMESMLSVSKNSGDSGSASSMGESMQMGAGMQTMKMQTRKMQGTKAPAPLAVRVAGHFFKGAPKYKVSLTDKAGQLLWTSKIRTLLNGYDTEKFGAMHDFNQLAWHTARYQPPVEALEKSVTAVVEFLNDAADKTGDRNLFVESVSLKAVVFPSAGGEQISSCVPQRPRYAGRLYCAGTVSISLHDYKADAEPRVADYTASTASVLWSHHRQNNLKAIIALENVQTPDAYYHTVSFHVISKDAKNLRLQLDSFGCWPDCIQQWPDCAWHDDHSQDISMSFPLARGKDEYVDCHYQSIKASEQALINALYASLPLLLDHLSATSVPPKQKSSWQQWQQRLSGFQKIIENSEYVQGATPFSINALYEKPAKQAYRIPEPTIGVNNVGEFERFVANSGLSLAELLIGGVSVDQFPALADSASKPFEQQLEILLAHPVYQVY